jgi:hypothetical protein
MDWSGRAAWPVNVYQNGADNLYFLREFVAQLLSLTPPLRGGKVDDDGKAERWCWPVHSRNVLGP